MPVVLVLVNLRAALANQVFQVTVVLQVTKVLMVMPVLLALVLSQV
jgi:hypothetical protein